VTINGAKVAEADKDMVFPAATVRMSAAVLKLGDRTMVSEKRVGFNKYLIELLHGIASVECVCRICGVRVDEQPPPSPPSTDQPTLSHEPHGTDRMNFQVDEAQVKFSAKGTAPTQAARSTALMVLNENQLAADKLGCTMGT
jgi:hypothetical protein